ncbi:unnamed protein product [Effrenium voratum]|nr:unnamed protein product [Effrenium voratum]
MFCCCESNPEVTVEVHSSPVLDEVGSAMAEPPARGAFTVKLELDDLKPRLLGVALDSTEEKGLLIVSILDGIISKYNERFPRQAIRKYDKITAVNGRAGATRELRRLMITTIADETSELLQLTLRRPEEMEVKLQRPGPLGLQVNYTDLLGGVLISKIAPGGLMDRWNSEHEGQVCKGDRIIALNGGDLKGEELINKLKSAEDLLLTILHY